MLLRIHHSTSRCAIFVALNNEIGHFLSACIHAKKFTTYLFSEKLRDAIWNNTPTKELFRTLWNALKVLEQREREEILREFKKGQSLKNYFADRGYPLPDMPDSVEKAIGNLCKHLFRNTSSLVGIKNACEETLHENFDKFRATNKNICCFCGTSELAQIQAGVKENDQWRAANDHLLAKDIYPIFAVHPDNLVPICETCNSKAKLKKDLINKKDKSLPGKRRLCFFPFTESCNEYVDVHVEEEDLGLFARVTMSSDSPEIQEKLCTWNEVYRIESRVEGKMSQLPTLVDNDCRANDLHEFRQRIKDKANSCNDYCRLESWNFWKYRLYEWLDADDNGIVEALWKSILDIRSDSDAAAVYGI